MAYCYNSFKIRHITDRVESILAAVEPFLSLSTSEIVPSLSTLRFEGTWLGVPRERSQQDSDVIVRLASECEQVMHTLHPTNSYPTFAMASAYNFVTAVVNAEFVRLRGGNEVVIKSFQISCKEVNPISAWKTLIEGH